MPASTSPLCGNVDPAARAISRDVWQTRVNKGRQKDPARGGKHVILLARPGQNYLSLYDSDNATLDSGELKDLALAASKALKTAVVFTSLYDMTVMNSSFLPTVGRSICF